MAATIQRAASRPRHGVDRRRALMLLVAIVAFLAITALRLATTDTHVAITTFYVFPIAIVAIELGARAGALTGVAASFAFLSWVVMLEQSPLSTIDIVARIVELIAVGVLAGWLAGARRRELAISRAVLDALPEPASVKSPDGRYLLVNPALERVLAAPHEQIVGRSTGYGQSLEVARRVEEADRRVLETGRPVEFEIDGDIPGVGSMSTRTIKAPVLDERGHVTAIVTLAHDISERVEHEREVLRLAAEARSEYERATGDYARLVRHRLANPLTVIECAGETLRTQYAADPAKRELLANLITEQVARLASIDLRAEQLGVEERELQGLPTTDLEQIEQDARRFAASIRQPFDRSGEPSGAAAAMSH